MKRGVKILLRLAVVGVVFLLLATLATYLMLASIVERNLPRSLAGADFSGQVRRIDISGADFENLRWGELESPAVRLNSLRLDYSLSGLRHREIEKIVLSGLTIDVDGLLKTSPTVKPAETTGDAAADPVAAALTPPFKFKTCEIRDGILIISKGGTKISLPFNAAISARGDKMKSFDINLRSPPDSGRIHALIELKKDRCQLGFSCALDGLNPAVVSDLLADIETEGKISGVIGGVCGLRPFKLDRLRGSFSFDDFSGAWSGKRFNAAGDNRISFSGSPGEWRFVAQGLALGNPLDISLNKISGTVVHRNTDFFAHIDGEAKLSPSRPSAVSIINDTTILFAAKLGMVGGHWRVDSAAECRRLEINAGGGDCRAETPRLLVGIDGAGKTWRMNCQAEASAISFTKGKVSLFGEKMLIAAYLNQELKGDFQVNPLAAKVLFPLGELSLPHLRVKGESVKPGALEVAAEFAAASVGLPAAGLTADGIAGKLFFSWPEGFSPSSGTLDTEKIAWRGHDIGGCSLNIKQDGLKFDTEGVLTINTTGDPLAAVLSGGLEFKPVKGMTADFNLDLPEQEFDYSIAGMDLNGKIAAGAKAEFTQSVLRGSFQTHLDDGGLRIPAHDIEIDGLTLDFELPDLPRPISAPAQELKFREARIGKISFGVADIRYQMENPRSWFIEKCRLNWCEGRLSAHALRLGSDKKDYSTTLFCDRLNLAELIGQLGVAEADGKGAVSGTIPLRLEEGKKLFFDDGFLCSAPDEGGLIKLWGTEFLTAGIPADNPRRGQMEMVKNALADFKYDWVKLFLNSADDGLTINFRFDGRPAKPLAFKTDSEGNWVHDESGGGMTHPMKLDLNCKLPLNELIGYGLDFNETLDKVNSEQ